MNRDPPLFLQEKKLICSKKGEIMVIFKALYTLEQVKKMLSLSDAALWELIERNRIRYVMIQQEKFIRGIDLEKYINSLEAF